MKLRKSHRTVNPDFAGRLLRMQAERAIQSAENEGWKVQFYQKKFLPKKHPCRPLAPAGVKTMSGASMAFAIDRYAECTSERRCGDAAMPAADSRQHRTCGDAMGTERKTIGIDCRDRYAGTCLDAEFSS